MRADLEESVAGIFISPARWSSPVKMMIKDREILQGFCGSRKSECGVGKIGAGLYSNCR